MSINRALANKRGQAICEAAATAPAADSFGLRAMAKMGWKPGKGLGKDEQGVNERVKVKKKQDSAGIGIAADRVLVEENWWEKAFESASSQLPESRRQAESVSSESEVDDEELAKMSKEDAELFRKCGGRRLSRRAGTDMKGKRRRMALADKALAGAKQ